MPTDFPKKMLENAQRLLRKQHPGVVLPAKDDDEGGGGAGTPLEPHPLFFSKPQGTSANLTVTPNGEQAMRDLPTAQLTPELAARLGIGASLSRTFTPKPWPR